jgi:phospholipid/cholesterol/gamma-HCH transport system substrate-binding protein
VRRALAVTALVVVAIAVVLVARGEEDGYRVRAIFDNAGFVVPGYDVRVAGVRVGQVEDVEVTPDVRAALVLRIEDPAYQDFRADARCTVRPQSLIGERFVECTPTGTRTVGEPPPPPLRRTAGGEHLLPVERTSTPVDLDLINNIMREPYRERLSIILNELGTGVAGRGRDLGAVIRRANPALREIDEVLAVLARQNRTLAALARDSDTVLAPLARQRRRVASALENIGEVAAATAERRASLEATIARLPRFLAELRPTMRRLGGLAGQATPVARDLGAVAPQVNTIVRELGPFSGSATTAFESLGEAGVRSIPAVRAARPLASDLAALGGTARPVGRRLADVLTSFERNDGLRQVMEFLFYSVAAINGYDAFGHYLRASLIVNQCSNYAVAPVAGCSSNFRAPSTTRLAAAPPPAAGLASSSRAPATGGAIARETTAAASPVRRAPGGGATASSSRAATGITAEDEALLDYLFGSDG